ncbi:unannotated protein [freshwater metagenome]|uniref:Unannotated protein n=1 Tax=freshwater metagenome TaxID=449393 RepID=A0A6J6JJV0_9ZZZZ
MQTTRHRIAAAAELSAGMKGRENNLDGGHLLYRVLIHGNTAPVVGDAHPAIGENDNVD